MQIKANSEILLCILEKLTCLGNGLDDEWFEVGGDLGSLTLSCNLLPPLVAADARAVTIALPEPGFFPPPK